MRLKGERANALPHTLEAPLMRFRVASLRRVVKGDLTIEFVPQALTSYCGPELLRRYLRRIALGARLRQAFTGLRGDYGSARIAMVGRLGGRNVLRLTNNPATETLYGQIAHRLAA
jgi:hypothetical protein